METVKLYYEDAFLKRFTGRVETCREHKGQYLVVLDRTAFYPEGGGQPCDTGTLGGADVTETLLRGETVLHRCTAALPVGADVTGEIDWARRLDLMQQHSGEHLVSGLIHARFGYENVGFHLGADLVTIDFNGEVDEQALQELVRHRLTATQRFEMSSDISQEEVLSTVLKADMQNIRSTIDGIDNAAFLRAVQVISGARRIYILGLRSAAPLAQFAGYYLHYIFDDVRVVAAGSTDVFEAISRIEASDVLLGISFPRYSSRTIEAMSFARSRHAQVIGLTDGPMSPLHEVADICLSMRTDMASFVDSMAAPMSVINALIVALGIQNREALNARFKQLEEVWDAYSVYMNEGK